jgi:hypothetical protein
MTGSDLRVLVLQALELLMMGGRDPDALACVRAALRPSTFVPVWDRSA